MKILNSFSEFKDNQKTAVAIGNFDGFHRGHQFLIDEMISYAKSKGLKTVVYTFKPHPKIALYPETDFKLINTYNRKVDLIAEKNIDYLICEPFSRDFSNLSSRDFIDKVLTKGLNTKALFFGVNFGFGKNRPNEREELIKTFYEFGIESDIVKPLEIDGELISSSRIRKLIFDGNILQAKKLMGNEYLLSGFVVKGEGRGRLLGFPTANLEVEEKYLLLPATGVYITKTKIKNEVYLSATSVGHNPTFVDKGLKVETHILDFSGDIYGANIEVEFIDRIRGEEKFSTKEELISKIKEDITIIKKNKGFTL